MHPRGLGAENCGLPAPSPHPHCVEERHRNGLGVPRAYPVLLCEEGDGFCPRPHTQEAHQPLVLAVEVAVSPVAPHFRPCPSSSRSRPSLQCPQPPAGLPAPACQASAAPAGLQALARLPLQWRCPAQSHPQLQHGTGWAGGWGHAAESGVGREGGHRGLALRSWV